MGILDYFTPEARRGNRQALEGLLMQFIPPEMRPQLNLLAELNPVVSMERAGQDAQQLFAPDQTLMDRLAAGGRMASNMAGVVAPAMVAGRAGVPVANAVQDVLTGYAPMVQPFMADEFGGVGFKAYHGSPHSFDKFSMDKIGTGEGAQAYGHGLYFAGNEDVAKGYRDALSNGWQFNSREPLNAAGLSGRDLDVASQMLSTSHSGDAAAADWESWLGKTLTPEQRAAFSDAFSRKGGSMYEVNINADPEAFVDIEKPLKDQPGLEPALRKYWGRHYDSFMNDGSTSDGDYFRQLSQDPANKNLNVQEMRDAGIPGLKYLDAGSRGSADVNELRGTVSMWTNAVNKTPNDDYAWKMLEDAESALKQAEAGLSRNYVVFDENLISIVRKYGIAGAAAMLGMSQADVAQAMGQQPQGLLESGPQ